MDSSPSLPGIVNAAEKEYPLLFNRRTRGPPLRGAQRRFQPSAENSTQRSGGGTNGFPAVFLRLFSAGGGDPDAKKTLPGQAVPRAPRNTAKQYLKMGDGCWALSQTVRRWTRPPETAPAGVTGFAGV